MNVSDQIIAVINTLCEKFGIAIDWTSENIVPYVEQLCKKYITYEIVSSTVTITLLLVMLAVSIILTRIWCKKANDDCWCDTGIFACAVVCIAATIVFCVVVCVICPLEINDIITCLTFPEKQIFEYVSSMMSANSV